MRERNIHRPGGFARSERRRKIYQQAAYEADQEIKAYQGEPTVSFFPSQIIDTEHVVVFDSNKGRNGDIAKRRGDIINTLLETPQEYPVTQSGKSFMRRNRERILRFAGTLKNKGRLHPQIGRILGI